jgi:hypothetical protein
MIRIGEEKAFVWYCTFEGGCECLAGDGKPALEDCIYCASLAFQCKRCGRLVGREEAASHACRKEGKRR